MKKFRELLGVENNVEFRLIREDGSLFDDFTYRFVNDILEVYDGDWLSYSKSDIGDVISDVILNDLSARTSWKPKYGDRYWYVDVDAVIETIWTDRLFDYYSFYCGNCFEAPKSARKHKKVYQKLLDRYHNP